MVTDSPDSPPLLSTAALQQGIPLAGPANWACLEVARNGSPDKPPTVMVTDSQDSPPLLSTAALQQMVPRPAGPATAIWPRLLSLAWLLSDILAATARPQKLCG